MSHPAHPLALSPDLSLPLDFVSRTIAILGIRGAGKTNTGSVLIEELLDRNLPAVVIDPTDAWWGIRSKYPVFIFGGSHGDVPLTETDGKVVAQFVVTEQVPVILSLRHLRKGAQRRFVTEFCEELYHLKGKDENRTALCVVIDEAPAFVPQKVMGENARTVGAVEDLIARGRSSGFGVVLISQRAATVNKDVLTQTDVIITHRLTSPQDRQALGEWFETNASTEKQKEILGSLASLPNGKAWVWAPTLDVMKLVQIRRRRTFDSSASPKVGEVVVAPKKLTEVNLEVLKSKMGAAIQQAKDNDPATLKARIRTLEQEAKKPAHIVSPPERVEVPVFSKSEIEKLDKIVGQLDHIDKQLLAIGGGIANTEDNLEDLLKGVIDRIKKISRPAATTGGATAPIAPRSPAAPRAVGRVQHDPKPGNGGAGDLGKCARVLLTVLVQFHPKGCTRGKLALVSGYSVNSSTFSNGLSELRVRTLMFNSGDILHPSPGGVELIGDSYEPLPEGDEAVRHWVNKLDKCPSAMLNAMHLAGGKMTKQELSEATGYSVTSSTFSNGLSTLRVMGLIHSDTDNVWIAPEFSA